MDNKTGIGGGGAWPVEREGGGDVWPIECFVGTGRVKR